MKKNYLKLKKYWYYSLSLCFCLMIISGNYFSVLADSVFQAEEREALFVCKFTNLSVCLCEPIQDAKEILNSSFIVILLMLVIFIITFVTIEIMIRKRKKEEK